MCERQNSLKEPADYGIIGMAFMIKLIAKNNFRRNAVSHHKLLVSCKLKKCIISEFEGSPLIDNIKNMRQLLPERYRYGKNGKGGITAELKKIGIKPD